MNNHKGWLNLKWVIGVAIALAVLSFVGILFLPDSGQDIPGEEVEILRIWYMVFGIAHSGSLFFALTIWVVSLRRQQLLRKKIPELIVTVMIVLLSSYVCLGAALSFFFRYRTMS